ncbi:MobA/MobL family protein [Psychrobacter sanguinis]|uniref:MobA/MobL family protein n=2 Tax=Psychrobacter sanguinis TaxID=861445 RepID=UPI001D1407E8|nr:MobA/MobL family protein [Psychrobacter sanguinis]UEC26988.1 MobA/MobL family protein [Psychrobacter sanguinis]
MTMVHIATKAISRKAGQSAVACAAYRAGDVLEDAKYGKVHDYSKKDGVMSSDIVMPASLRKGYVKIDREILWNTAEAFEARSDSRVAREWLINLPYELPEDERHALALEFAQKLCDDMNVIADVCLHRPVMKLPFDPNAKPSSKRLREGEQNPDPRNFHAHIMVTTRAPVIGPEGKLAFDPKFKIPFEWSNKKRKQNDLPSSREEIKRIRKLWVDTANQRLKQHNLPLMDERSYKDQGLDQQPTIKMGVEATAMERRGIATEKGETNRKIQARNHAVLEQRREYERRIQQYRDGLAWATGQNERLSGLIADTERRADSTKRCIEDAKSGTAWATKRCENLPKWINDADKANHKAQQGIDVSKRWVTANSKRAADSESIAQSIHQDATKRARPAPTPFDDKARRARAARLDQQQRRIDRETRRATYEDQTRSERAEQLKLRLAHKLLTATQPDNCLRPGWNDDPNDYPDKYDYRQIEVIKDFVTSLNLQSKNFRDNLTAVKNKIDERFIANNKDLIHLVNHPKQEREQYNELLTAWFEFKEDIDQKRADFNQSIIPKLGGSAGEVGRMTRDIISSFDYIRGLDQFISDDKQTIEARELAKSHRSDTLNRTCLQFKYAYSDVAKLPSGQRESHINALNSTVEVFKNIYGSQLLDEQNKAIEDGLRAFNNDLQRSHRPSRGFSR